jgi:hypothetical protein
VELINKKIINLSDKYKECDQKIFNKCSNSIGDYCLFGYKWGLDSVFLSTGINANGPKSDGGIVIFSFQSENQTVNTHSQINLKSKPFSFFNSCSKDEIRKAINTWMNKANIKLVEELENSPSNIRFFVAEIRQSAVGYSNYNESLCSDLDGDIIFATDSFRSCNFFYLLALHEIGHALGLGHVKSNNIMSRDFYSKGIDDLQSGDIKGIIELYGQKAIQ